jgi:hypothetical protein
MSNNLESPANIFNLENAVMADLTNFNKEYRLYLTCRDKDIDRPGTDRVPLDFFNRDICQGNTKMSRAALDTAYERLTNSNKTGSLDRLTDAVNSLSPNTGGTLNDYKNNYNNILLQYKEIVKNRQSLDAKLSELYQIGDTTSNFYQKKLVSTSYTKILLTVLATSLVVTAFVVAQRKT